MRVSPPGAERPARACFGRYAAPKLHAQPHAGTHPLAGGGTAGQEAEQASSMLPLYIGIGVLAIGAVTVAVVLVRRRMEEGGKRSRYHRGR